MPTPAESGFRHGISTMPKLRVGMPPAILAIMPQMAKVLYRFKPVESPAGRNMSAHGVSRGFGGCPDSFSAPLGATHWSIPLSCIVSPFQGLKSCYIQATHGLRHGLTYTAPDGAGVDGKDISSTLWCFGVVSVTYLSGNGRCSFFLPYKYLPVGRWLRPGRLRRRLPDLNQLYSQLT